MRIAIASTLAALVALGVFTLARLGESLKQVQALGSMSSRVEDRTRVDYEARLADSTREPAVRADLEPLLDESEARANAQRAGEADDEPGDTPLADERAVVASGGDEHIRQWLAADVELRRAAEELLREPDPEMRQEARRLLRDLGVLDEP